MIKLASQSPFANSHNGKDFDYFTPSSNPLPVGSYVKISTEDNCEYLGQIITQGIVEESGTKHAVGVSEDAHSLELDASSKRSKQKRVNYSRGMGNLLCRIEQDSYAPITAYDVFQDAKISRAPHTAISSYFLSTIAQNPPLEIGVIKFTDNQVRATLNPSDFYCHSFLCGQTRSGKTWALGVILEQLLLNTSLRIVVIDPNSDFIKLDQFHSIEDINKTRSENLCNEQYEAIRKRWDLIRTLIRIIKPKSQTMQSASNLSIRFSDLEKQKQEAILGLKPSEDPNETALFWLTVRNLVKRGCYSFADVYKCLERSARPPSIYKLLQRIKNQGILDWEIWCPAEGPSLIDELEGNWSCLIADIGVLDPPQNVIIAETILDFFWRKRDEFKRILIVMDEAHNICPQSPISILYSMAAESAVRIAAEGNKFGMHLFLASQSPEKVNFQVVASCPNLLLMRMNSVIELEDLKDAFSFVPESLLSQSLHFQQGEALLAFNSSSRTVLAKFEGRLTHTGGGDII
jgi:uncharacterized protein